MSQQVTRALSAQAITRVTGIGHPLEVCTGTERRKMQMYGTRDCCGVGYTTGTFDTANQRRHVINEYQHVRILKYRRVIVDSRQWHVHLALPNQLELVLIVSERLSWDRRITSNRVGQAAGLQHVSTGQITIWLLARYIRI